MDVKQCETCNMDFSRPVKVGAKQWATRKFCSRLCVRFDERVLGPKTRYRKGPRNGHRAIMERHLGRKLRTDEHVHHRNGDKLDNRIGNLEIVWARDHGLAHHPPVHPVEKDCVICRARFRPHKTKRKRQQTCSWDCRNALCALNRWPDGTVASAVKATRAPQDRP